MSIQNIKDELLASIDKSSKELLELASNLIKIKSVNPPGDMTEIAAFIQDLLEENGLKVERIEPEPGRITLISSIGSGDKELVLNGHMDVVPVGDPTRWSFDPFSGKIVDGYLLGRGASDMKGGLAGLIWAFIKASKYESLFNGKLTLVVVPDEETGGLYGTKYLVDNGIHLGTSVIIGEPTGIDFIDVGQKGILWLKMVFHGKPTHGSLAPYVGDNAVFKACSLLAEIRDAVTKLESNPPEDIKPVIEESMKIAEKLIGIKGIGIILRKPSFNLGIIKGGVKTNIVPDTCEAHIDIRLPIGLPSSRVLETIKEKTRGENVDIEVLTRYEANYTSPNSEIVKIVEENISRIVGVKPKVFVQWASSDARFYRLKGIPTIHYGPAIVEGIHGYDEKVKAEDIVKASKVYAASIIDYLTA